MEIEDFSRRHAMWIARSMARTDATPLTGTDVVRLEQAFAPVRVPAGTVLCNEGVPAREVHILREGRVHLAIRNPATGRQTVGLLGPGGVVGDISVLTGQTMNCDAYADTECTLLSIDRDRFLVMLSESPTLSMRWATSIAQRVEEGQRRLTTLLTKDLAAQIATLLLDHRIEHGGVWTVPMPHQTIAHLLGARRQSVSRVLGQMRRDGLVRSRYGAVDIVDMAGVALLAGEEVAVDALAVSA